MATTHYIEIDEEIISAVGRLRKSGDAENIFVLPKRALLLQSIVSLKLLEREARKLGKKITLMTQDAAGEALAVKAGLPVQPYREQSVPPPTGTPSTRFAIQPGETIPMPVRPSPLAGTGVAPHSSRLGSGSFFDGRLTTKVPESPSLAKSSLSTTPDKSRTLRIRNASPTPLTSLNSLRTDSMPASPVGPRSIDTTTRSTPRALPATRPQPSSPSQPTSPRSEKLARFLGTRASGEGTGQSISRVATRPEEDKEPSSVSPAAPWTFVLLACFSAIALIGAVLFLVLPTATVFLIPQGTEESLRYQFTGVTSDAVSGERRLSARVVSMEKTITLSLEATGAGGGVVGKARGTVIITNNFSSAAQPLVATTRLLSAEGKLFRLVEGVTVPGRREGENGEPGVVEASVVADQSGSDFNIAPTTFTIPGFQGGPKFEKITARSTKPMSGGGSDSADGVKSVSREDRDQAAERAKNEARERFLEETNASLKAGEKLLEETIEVTPIGSPTAPAVGSTTNPFPYEARFTTRAFVVSEEAIREFINRQTVTSNENPSVVLKPVTTEFTYGRALANFNESVVELSVEAALKLRAPLDTGALKSELVGLDEDGIRAFLERHPEIKRLRVEFKPSFLITSLPKNQERLHLTVLNDEE